MMRRRALILIAALGCARSSSPRPAPVPLSAAEHAIYAVIISDVAGGVPASLVVMDTTLDYKVPAPNSLLERRPEPDLVRLRVQLAALTTEHPQRSPLALFPNLELLPRAEALRRADAGLGGIKVLAVSRIAFGADSLHALVYRQIHCGALCGDGSELLFVQDGDRWTLVRSINHWSS